MIPEEAGKPEQCSFCGHETADLMSFVPMSPIRRENASEAYRDWFCRICRETLISRPHNYPRAGDDVALLFHSIAQIANILLDEIKAIREVKS